MPPKDNSSVTVTSTDDAPPLPPVLAQTNNVLEITSLNANAGHPARLSNLGYSNVVTNTNTGSQNAVANQQAHSQLALSILGSTTGRVQALTPLEARSSVDVLTNDEVAQSLADLGAVLAAFGAPRRPRPGPIRRELDELIRILGKIFHTISGDARISGDGTAKNPYSATQGPIFVQAPITLGFLVPPDQLNFAAAPNDGVRIENGS